MTQTIAAKTSVLHVGCGPRNAAPVDARFGGDLWQEIRLDIDPSAEPDIVGSITDMSIVPSNSIDALYSAHNLEYLYSHDVPVALREFHRVLKVGCVAVVRVPDIQRVAEHVATGNLEGVLYRAPAGAISALDVMYGFRKALAEGKPSWAHKTAFMAKTLGRKLVGAAFRRVQVARKGFQLFPEVNK